MKRKAKIFKGKKLIAEIEFTDDMIYSYLHDKQYKIQFEHSQDLPADYEIIKQKLVLFDKKT